RLAEATGLPADTSLRLARLYGSEEAAVVARGPEPIAPGVVAGEIEHAIAVEAARTLEDVVYRRTRAALYDPDAREALVAPAATHMAARLGWSTERVAAEQAHVRARLAADLAFL